MIVRLWHVVNPAGQAAILPFKVIPNAEDRPTPLIKLGDHMFILFYLQTPTQHQPAAIADYISAQTGVWEVDSIETFADMPPEPPTRFDGGKN